MPYYTMPTLTLEITEAEAEAIRACARENQVDFDTYARCALHAAASGQASVRKYKTDLTPGRVVIDGPPVSDEVLYAAIHDYGDDKYKSDLVGETSIKPGRVVIATPPMTREAIDAALYDY